MLTKIDIWQTKIIDQQSEPHPQHSQVRQQNPVEEDSHAKL